VILKYLLNIQLFKAFFVIVEAEGSLPTSPLLTPQLLITIVTSENYPASYAMGTWLSFPRNKVARTW
jgi:hypothetical protein